MGTEASDDDRHPRIDVSPALHEAGHEVEELGFEGLPDDGPLVGHDADAPSIVDELDVTTIVAPPD
jgi:hypothetical protein